MATYVALIDGEAGRLGVTFPDLPGCVTMGATEHEALVKAGEALAFHIDGLRRHGLPVPAPRSLETLRQGQEYAEDFAGAKAVALVSAGETADPAVADAAG
jgi:predicted RNase H-like HicB family nuclease